MMIYVDLWLFSYYPDAPWCWNIYLHLPQTWPSFVGKYSSTMEHLAIKNDDFPVRKALIHQRVQDGPPSYNLVYKPL